MTTHSPTQVGVMLVALLLVGSSVGLGVAQQPSEGSLTFSNQVTAGDSVTVASVTLPNGGFVGIVDENGFLIGVSPISLPETTPTSRSLWTTPRRGVRTGHGPQSGRAA
ncbi:hypothetical protein VB779_21790 [Haloarculaceae archaeon H-GB11]|nr:hypothetical protein [Haloarculaceae archaeon H-GB11]